MVALARRGDQQGRRRRGDSDATCRTRSSTIRSAVRQRRTSSRSTCRGSRRDTVGAYALSEPASGSDAFGMQTRAEKRGDALGPQRPEDVDHQRRRGARSTSCSRTRIRRPATRGSRRSSSSAASRDSRVGKKEDKLGIRASSTTELILDDVEVPAENVLGPVGQGYKIAIETLNEGRIGIGAQMIGVAQGALARRDRVREGAQAVRQEARRVSGHSVPARAGAHRARGGAAHGVQRGAAQGRRARHRDGRRDGEAVLVAGRASA